MKIGETLYLDIQTDGNKFEKYRSKLIDKNEHYLFIDYPIHDRTQKTLYLPNNKRFYVTYRVQENVYRFRSYVVKRIQAHVPTIAIYLPPKEEHERIQRREYVRIETAVDVAIHCPNETFTPFTTVTADISGGGLSIYVEREVFDVDQPINVQIVLQMASGEFQYLFAEASFIRYNQRDVKMASLKFTDISKQDQQLIIQYCFEKQREERKKELI